MPDKASLLPHREAKLERSRWPPLARMLTSGELSMVAAHRLSKKELFKKWMLHAGYRLLSILLFILVHVIIFAFGLLNYQMKDNLYVARTTFGLTYPIARASALVLHFDMALILFPICHSLLSLLRQTPLHGIIQFDRAISFHKLVAYSVIFFSAIHTVAHWNNFARLATKNKLGIRGFLLANFTSGPGWSGYLMLVCLIAITVTSTPVARNVHYERFWSVHHLFILFFVFFSLHGAFCMIKPDLPPFCAGTGVFYQFWMYGGFIYLLERVLREFRGRHKTLISKVVQHPSRVVEIQIKKEHIKTRAGQYVFINCPEISLWQYHPFTLTSAPEEDYISVHIRCIGDFTNALAKVLGCDFDSPGLGDTSSVTAVDKSTTASADVNPSIRRILPRLYIDGPFGSASEDVFKYEVAILVGAGIGVTPFASILKSIWYRMNYPQKQTRLRKVYFFWVCRDFGSFEWLRSLLMAIESQDMDNLIEIHTYLTAKISPSDATNIQLNDADTHADAITGLRAPTNFGRPNWDTIFKSIRRMHEPTEAGVFFCGPKPLSDVLAAKCRIYSGGDIQFTWGKENF